VSSCLESTTEEVLRSISGCKFKPDIGQGTARIVRNISADNQPMVKQLNLFKQQSLNVGREFKECLANIVSESGFSRAEFLDRMNEVASRFGIRLMKGNGEGLTMATFEKWLNVDQSQYMPPIAALTVICEVGNTIEPLQIFARSLGLQVIDEPRIKRLMWADAYHDARKARNKMKKLEAEI
jgi:hypothetical protein